jgi:hypothetical protein
MSNLSYEFYYLLRTSIDPDMPIHFEPDSFASIAKSSLRHGGLAIDEDKRLFRFDAYGWRDILQFYHLLGKTVREVRRDLRNKSRHFNKVNLPCLSNGNLSERQAHRTTISGTKTTTNRA